MLGPVGALMLLAAAGLSSCSGPIGADRRQQDLVKFIGDFIRIKGATGAVLFRSPSSGQWRHSPRFPI